MSGERGWELPELGGRAGSGALSWLDSVESVDSSGSDELPCWPASESSWGPEALPVWLASLDSGAPDELLCLLAPVDSRDPEALPWRLAGGSARALACFFTCPGAAGSGLAGRPGPGRPRRPGLFR